MHNTIWLGVVLLAACAGTTQPAGQTVRFDAAGACRVTMPSAASSRARIPGTLTASLELRTRRTGPFNCFRSID